MHRALVRNLLQPRLLFLSQGAGKRDGALDAMHESLAAILAFLAVRGVDASLAQLDGYLFQWPALSARIECRDAS